MEAFDRGAAGFHQRARLTDIALALGLLRTGGSDWHGDAGGDEPAGSLGSQEVPAEWLDRLLDAEWLINHIWCGLFVAFHLPETPGRTPREAREMCLRTLTKAAGS